MVSVTRGGDVGGVSDKRRGCWWCNNEKQQRELEATCKTRTGVKPTKRTSTQNYVKELCNFVV